MKKYIALTSKQMQQADEYTIRQGISGEELMERAGQSVVDVITERYAPRKTVIYCGSGNNGGDGFVIERLLKEMGWEVEVVDCSKPLCLPENSELIIDGIFGTGLSREITGDIKNIIEEINNSNAVKIAIDIPSGINGTTGQIMGVSVNADITVTFSYPKIGHFILPAKKHIGELIIKDIGIETSPLQNPNCFINTPDLWQDKIKLPSLDTHKYNRGHSVIIGGGFNGSTGAGRLASIVALRLSGLTTVICPKSALLVYATSLMSVMVKGIDDIDEFVEFIKDERKNAFAIGMGCGINENTKEKTLAILELNKKCVVDADAITVFKDNPQELFDALNSECVLTPHECEFKRLFSVQGSKVEMVKQAAKIAGCTVLLKGNDTVIASPDGKVVINNNAPVWLATAGSGDVLSGIICGLIANGMSVFDATCAGVWIHGDTANKLGYGMIAEDLLFLLSIDYLFSVSSGNNPPKNLPPKICT